MCDAITTNFEVKSASELSIKGTEGHLVAFNKGSSEFTRPLFSFVPPSAGMFIWATFYFEDCQSFQVLKKDSGVEDPEQKFSDILWAALAKELVSSSSMILE